VWGHDLRERNARFLRSIDPGYFAYVARLNGQQLDSSAAQYAALSLRITYSQASEALFALLCAALQAPDFPLGWLLAYRNEELRSLVTAIDNGAVVLERVGLNPPSWTKLSALINRFDKASEAKAETQAAFARFWEALGRDFRDPLTQSEYNSIKHGFRVVKGGTSLAFRASGESDYRTIKGSPFGTSFWTLERPDDVQERELKRCNATIAAHSRNWNAKGLATGLELVAASMNNVLAFLRAVAKDREGQLLSPEDLGAFDEPWQPVGSLAQTSFSEPLPVAEQHLLRQAAVLAVYDDGPLVWDRELTESAQPDGG